MSATSELLRTAVDAAREAGAFLRASVGSVRTVETKQGQETNLVTDIDKKAEEMIIGRIRKVFPSHGFLAEESGGASAGADTVWVIDPLDGTTNFTHGLPIFCVSIGVLRGGELAAGAIYDPNHDELYTAEKGGGAFLNGERIHVSGSTDLRRALLVTGFPYNVAENPYNAIGHFTAFLTRARAVRRLGSAAIDFCYVAAGRFDGFWEVSLNPWDMAAGVLLVQEAGGMVTDFRGGAWTIDGKNVLATNGQVHRAMMDVLAKNLA